MTAAGRTDHMRTPRNACTRPRRAAVVLTVAVGAALLASCGDGGEVAGTPETRTSSASDTTATTIAKGAVALSRTCEADRYEVDYPAGWSANAGDVVPRCRFFHPEPFTVPEATEVVDRAVIFDVEATPFARMVEAIGGASETVVARR